MNRFRRACCICSAEADWVRVRMPNAEQMNYLCTRHYQALQQNNAVLAGFYDDIEIGTIAEVESDPLLQAVPDRV